MSRLNALRTAPTLRFHQATALVLALLTASFAAPADAKKVYRCGNVFQDQPCPEVKVALVPPVERPLVASETPCPTSSRGEGARGPCVGKAARDGLREAPVDIKR